MIHNENMPGRCAIDNHIKITEIKCPGCGSTLKMPSDGTGFVKCEYCGGEYAVSGLQGEAVQRKVPDWRPAPPVRQVRKEESKFSRILYSLVVFAIFGTVIYLMITSQREKEKEAEKQEMFAALEENAALYDVGKADGEDDTAFPGLLGEAVSAAFGKDADTVTEAELTKIKWIADKSDRDCTYIGYSFEDPLENAEAEIVWLTFPNSIGTRYESGYENLAALRGLKRLETNKSLSECRLEGLQLTSLIASVSSLGEAAAALDDPNLIKELGIESSLESLEGLELFPNVEKLSLSASRLKDINEVTAAKRLKSLTLDSADVLHDFAVFGAIENLEELNLASENIKVLNFVDRLPQLKSLGISDGKLLDLSGLEALQQLEKLSVTDCSELENMKAVESLTGLKELILEKPHDCAEPSLAGLTSLESLTLKNFRSCGFLESLTNLKKLSLQSCDLPENIDLSGLTGLRELSCTTSLSDRSFAFVKNMPSLESVNMRGIVTYEDISGIFALPHLKELDLSGAECEIDFEKVGENPSLETLAMAEMKLYENVDVSGGGGLVYVTQDDVYLAEHLDFLQAFPNLRRLNLAGNEIKDIGFAESLGKLEELDISDNYVTELRPLAAIPGLRVVNCKGNPIDNLQVLDDSVLVISE